MIRITLLTAALLQSAAHAGQQAQPPALEQLRVLTDQMRSAQPTGPNCKTVLLVDDFEDFGLSVHPKLDEATLNSIENALKGKGYQVSRSVKSYRTDAEKIKRSKNYLARQIDPIDQDAAYVVGHYRTNLNTNYGQKGNKTILLFGKIGSINIVPGNREQLKYWAIEIAPIQVLQISSWGGEICGHEGFWFSSCVNGHMIIDPKYNDQSKIVSDFNIPECR